MVWRNVRSSRRCELASTWDDGWSSSISGRDKPFGMRQEEKKECTKTARASGRRDGATPLMGCLYSLRALVHGMVHGMVLRLCQFVRNNDSIEYEMWKKTLTDRALRFWYQIANMLVAKHWASVGFEVLFKLFTTKTMVYTTKLHSGFAWKNKLWFVVSLESYNFRISVKLVHSRQKTSTSF